MRSRAPHIALLLTWTIGLCLVSGSGVALAQTGSPRVVLQPSDAQGNAVAGPGYYRVTTRAGHHVTLYALVGNMGQKQATVQLVPVDARSGVYGGISYNLPNQRRSNVGSWVRLSRTSVKLPVGKAAVVKFTVRVPKTAKPGQYVGALTGFVPTRKTKGGIGAIQIQFRRVTAIVVTVQGPTFSRFTITRVDPVRRPQGVYIIAHIKNSGNMLLQGNGNLWVWKIGRKKPVIFVHLSLDTTVPHTTVNYPVPWTNSPPPGKYSFRALVWWNGGKTSKTGRFAVKAITKAKPCRRTRGHRCK